MSYEVQVKKSIKAAPEAAFNAFADGAIWSKWFSANTSVDLRKGGRFKNDDGDTGEILDFIPNKLLTFTWEGSFAGSRVELQFRAAGEGCEVSLRHYMLGAQADVDKMRNCWTWTLDNLASFLETEKPLSMADWKKQNIEIKPTPLKGFAFNLLYVDDLDKAVGFYEKHFGFTKKFSMEDGSCWGKTGDLGLWIGGGYKRSDLTEKSTRTSVMYSVASAGALFAQLKQDGVPVMQETPQEMGCGDYWFQFADPSGNIIEVLGGQ